MGDVLCKWCGEPWEYYHLKHELDDGVRVLEGDGCPSCSWGSETSSNTPSYPFAWKESIIKETDENVMDYI